MARCTKHYETLGVKPEATHAEIQKAYRRAAMKHHPDRPGGSTEEFKKVEAAGQILLDKEKRAQYDAGELSDGDLPLEVRVERMLIDIFIKGFVEAGQPWQICWRQIQGEVRKQREGIRGAIDKLESNLAALDKQGRDEVVPKPGQEKHGKFRDDLIVKLKAAGEVRLTAMRSDLEFITHALEKLDAFSTGQQSPTTLAEMSDLYSMLRKTIR